MGNDSRERTRAGLGWGNGSCRAAGLLSLPGLYALGVPKQRLSTRGILGVGRGDMAKLLHYSLLTHCLGATQEGSALGFTPAWLGHWPGATPRTAKCQLTAHPPALQRKQNPALCLQVCLHSQTLDRCSSF